MAVLAVLVGSLIFYRLLGAVGVDVFASWLNSARVALTTMFLFTATSHFAPMKEDLIAMVPPRLARPDLLVFITGVAELAGAIGLLIPMTRFWAACGLMTLMILMFPANASAAMRGTRIRGRQATALWATGRIN
ncbi:MAG TPA: DoxX family protein [Vicinamibacterales bacterium]|jgi:uncharacterized membrane protein|nr:DoxX family protein [Vicinamibacterales bacterium]